MSKEIEETNGENNNRDYDSSSIVMSQEEKSYLLELKRPLNNDEVWNFLEEKDLQITISGGQVSCRMRSDDFTSNFIIKIFFYNNNNKMYVKMIDNKTRYIELNNGNLEISMSNTKEIINDEEWYTVSPLSVQICNKNLKNTERNFDRSENSQRNYRTALLDNSNINENKRLLEENLRLSNENNLLNVLNNNLRSKLERIEIAETDSERTMLRKVRNILNNLDEIFESKNLGINVTIKEDERVLLDM